MYLKALLFMVFLLAGLSLGAQEAVSKPAGKGPADKMMLRSNTRDRIIMMRANRYQQMIRVRRQENLYQDHRQLQRRMMINRQQRMMRNTMQRNMQRQSMQRQMMQQRGGPRR